MIALATFLLHVLAAVLYLFVGSLVLTGITRLMNWLDNADDTLGQIAQEMGPAIFVLALALWPLTLIMVLAAIILGKLEDKDFGETPEWVVKLADEADRLLPGSKVDRE